jgi:hypothetical protein
LWLDVLAAAESPSAGVSDQLIIIVGGVITAAITVLGGVLVAIVNSRTSRTAPSPPAPVPTINEHELYERTAVLRQRADDNDERDAVQDVRLEKFERWAEHHDPEWWDR